MKITKILSFITFTFPIVATALDSTRLIASNAIPVQRNVTISSNDCTKTKEVVYSVSMVTNTSAYPACPPNTVVHKVNLRNEQFLTDVVTYVSLDCCKQKTGWQQNGSKVAMAISSAKNPWKNVPGAG